VDRTIAVNDAWRIAPWADVLYGADGPWWMHHRGVPRFAGEKWTQDKGPNSLSRPRGGCAADLYGLSVARSEANGPGVSLDPGYIRQGANSGFQALNLAALFGAARIWLLGFDMQHTGGRKHFFGPHPGPLDRGHSFKKWVAAFNTAAPQLAAAGIEVINCTRETALACFPRVAIEDL